MLRKIIAGLVVFFASLGFVLALPDYVATGSPYYVGVFLGQLLTGSCGVMLWRAQSQLDSYRSSAYTTSRDSLEVR